MWLQGDRDSVAGYRTVAAWAGPTGRLNSAALLLPLGARHKEDEEDEEEPLLWPLGTRHKEVRKALCASCQATAHCPAWHGP